MKKSKFIQKHKKASNKKKNIVQKFFSNIILLLFRSTKYFLNLGLQFFKKKPKLFAIFCITFIATVLLILCINKIVNYSESILPNSVNIEINSPKIYSLINNDLTLALAYAQKNHEKRSHFLNRVNNILFSYDQIDQYWIRLGFDRKLQIVITLQVPLLILEAKGGDKYVVSSTSKIIAKNPNINEYPGLYFLSAPSIKINWKPKSSAFKYRTSLANNFKAYSTNYAAVNFPWLINQTKIIYSNFQNLGLNFLLNKVTWNSISGYQLNLTEQKNSSVAFSTTGETVLTVLLGKDKLVAKIKGLKSVLEDLSHNNLHPSEIDLDFTDKASFKISASTISLPTKIF